MSYASRERERARIAKIETKRVPFVPTPPGEMSEPSSRFTKYRIGSGTGLEDVATALMLATLTRKGK